MLLKARDHQGVLYMEKRSENSASEFSYLENQGEKREPPKKTEKSIWEDSQACVKPWVPRGGLASKKKEWPTVSNAGMRVHRMRTGN